MPTLLVVAGVVGAYCLLSLALRRGMPMGVAYGLWTALAWWAAAGHIAPSTHGRWSEAGGMRTVTTGSRNRR